MLAMNLLQKMKQNGISENSHPFLPLLLLSYCQDQHHNNPSHLAPSEQPYRHPDERGRLEKI